MLFSTTKTVTQCISFFFLQEFAKEEESLRAVYQSVHSIYELLKSDTTDEKVKPLEEITLDATASPLQQQFNLRAPFVMGR